MYLLVIILSNLIVFKYVKFLLRSLIFDVLSEAFHGGNLYLNIKGVLMKYLLALIGLISMPLFASTGDLQTSDITGISFIL